MRGMKPSLRGSFFWSIPIEDLMVGNVENSKWMLRLLFAVGHGLISFLFIACGVLLIVISAVHLWHVVALSDAPLRERIDTVLESLAIVTVALAALEPAVRHHGHCAGGPGGDDGTAAAVAPGSLPKGTPGHPPRPFHDPAPGRRTRSRP